MAATDEEPVNLICRYFREVHDEYIRLVQNIDYLKAYENEVVKKVKEIEDNCLQSEKAASIINILNSVREVTAERNTCLKEKLTEMNELLKDNIHYLPCGPQTHSFKYIGGDSPWNFWLQDVTVDIKLLHKTLMEKHEKKELKKLCSLPEVNTYVCYVERNKVFRGKVLRLLENNRVKLVDVDTSCIKRIPQENLYETDSTTCEIHALAVNCSLSENFQDERMWSTDLGKIFSDVLANGTLAVNICKKLNDAPVFLVNVQVTSEEENCVNMKEWICQRIIPELRRICDKGLEPLGDYLSPRAQDAYAEQFISEDLNIKNQSYENKLIDGNSGECQCNPESAFNSCVDESQTVNYNNKSDTDQQKLKTGDLLEISHEPSNACVLEDGILDSNVIHDKDASLQNTTEHDVLSEESNDIKDDGSCISTSQEPEKDIVPIEKLTVSVCESVENCAMKDAVQKNKGTVDLFDVCKELKRLDNDTKANCEKTEVGSGRYVQNNMVNKAQPTYQKQGGNLSYSPAPYQPFVYPNPSSFFIPPVFSNQQYPFVPGHLPTIPSPPFHPNIIPSFGYNRQQVPVTYASKTLPSDSCDEKMSSNYIPFGQQLSAYKVKIPQYPVWSSNTHSSERTDCLTKENVDSPLFNNSVYLRELSASQGLISEHQNKNYTIYNPKSVSPATFRTSYTQDYESTDASCGSSSDSGVKNYHVNLKKPSTLLTEGEKLKVMLSHVASPWNLYVHFPTENNICIDKLKVDMKNYYSAYVKRTFPPYPWYKLKEMFGNYCACFWNDYWYRVEVLDWNDNGKARVFFVDYGNEEIVALCVLRPLFVQFTEFNMMAQHCHLADVFPVSSEDNCWPEYAKQFFCSLLDIETPCTVIIVSSKNKYVSNSLGVVLFHEDDGTDYSISVNDIMVQEGLAVTPNRTLKSDVNEEMDLHNSDGGQNDNIDEDTTWKKSSLQSKDCNRAYSVCEKDTDDACVAITGYKAQDERRICKFYSRNGYCWKRVCTKEHSFLNEGGVTSDKVLVYNEAFTSLGLPDIGQILVVKVTAVFSLSHFYVQMQERLSGCFRKEVENEIETLSSLSEYINSPTNVKSLKHLTVHPDYSQLVLAKNEDGIWYRARVMEMCENDKAYEVMYVDYGTVENISLDNMREIEPRYLHLPFQAIQCDLANVKLSEENCVNEKAADIFRDEFVCHDLKAEVVNRYSQYNCLSLKLFCDKKGDIGEWLHSKGICELAQTIKHDSMYIV